MFSPDLKAFNTICMLMTPKFISAAQSLPIWPLNISAWTSNRHFKINMSQTVLLKPHTIKQTNNDETKPIWLMIISLSVSQAIKFGVIFDYSLALLSHL